MALLLLLLIMLGTAIYIWIAQRSSPPLMKGATCRGIDRSISALATAGADLERKRLTEPQAR